MVGSANHPRRAVDRMLANHRRLLIAHAALAVASIVVYWLRPGALIDHFHLPRRAYALLLMLQTLIACIPYLISISYSGNKLSARDPKATVVFIGAAVGIAAVAALLILNVIGLQAPPPVLLVLAGVTLALLAAARLCAMMGRAAGRVR
jgi:hypothetical protein